MLKFNIGGKYGYRLAKDEVVIYEGQIGDTIDPKDDKLPKEAIEHFLSLKQLGKNVCVTVGEEPKPLPVRKTIQEEYVEVTGKRLSNNKKNDTEWLKQKIKEAKDTEKSEEETPSKSQLYITYHK